METYGIIGGKAVNFMADEINKKLVGGDILGMARWTSIDHFQRTLKANKIALRNLDKIMVLDGVFLQDNEDLNNREIAKRALNDFLYLEWAVKQELEGVFLVLYTKSPVLDAVIKNYYQKDKITKYRGTINLLTTNGYQASGIAKILGTRYTQLSDENVNLVNKTDEDEIKRRVAEQAEIYKLMGQREELRAQIGTLNKRMDLVDRQLNNFLIGDRSDDLDVVGEILGDSKGGATTLTDEIESILNG